MVNKLIKMALLRVFGIREDYLVQGGVGAEADADALAALFRVPKIAALPHAGAEIGEGADGGVIEVHNRRPRLRKQELGSEGSFATLNEYTMD
jgi:hypothetical protein